MGNSNDALAGGAEPPATIPVLHRIASSCSNQPLNKSEHAPQGVEAQTLANVWLALENDLEIIPVLNKIDLPGADPDRVALEIEEIIGLDCSNILKVRHSRS